jgi:hypothetical protein
MLQISWHHLAVLETKFYLHGNDCLFKDAYSANTQTKKPAKML